MGIFIYWLLAILLLCRILEQIVGDEVGDAHHVLHVQVEFQRSHQMVWPMVDGQFPFEKDQRVAQAFECL